MPQEEDSKPPAATMGIERMYQIYEKLNSAEDKTTLETEYRQFLDAAHRSDKEKRLASQFITRFVEYFPNSYDDAVNAMLDLCEEEDLLIRKQVLKDLITVCKKVKTCIPKVADVFSQLMLTADSAELQNINAGFVSLFHIDAKGTLAGLFSQIRGGPEVMRETAIKLLVTRVKDLSPEIATLQFQRALYYEIKRIIRWVSEEEFNTFVDLIMSTKLMKLVGGQQLIMDLLYEAIGVEEMLFEKTHIHCLFTATDHVLSICNSQIPPDKFIVYYFTKVIPAFQELIKLDNYVQQGILKRLCELLVLMKPMNDGDLRQCLDSAMTLAFEILPPIPSESQEIVEKSDDELKMPNFNFSHAECSLFFIHKLGSFLPEYLPSMTGHEEFRSRIQFLNRGASAYERKLREDFKNHQQKKMDLQTVENKQKISSLKIVKNLNTLIRDLFQKPPKYTGTVILSWKPLAKPQLKRPAIAPSYLGHKAIRTGKDREIQRYQPPGGKYSRGGSFGPGSYGSGGRGRGGSRGRGNYRGSGRRF